MKIRHFIITLPCMTLGITSNAIALSASIGGSGTGTEITRNSCSTTTCTDNADIINTVYEGCTSTSKTCYKRSNDSKTYVATNCTGCASGYKQVSFDIDVCCGNEIAGSCSKQYTICMKICDKGKYASTSSCPSCPSYNGISGTTAGTGATSITECYIPAGTYSDSTGTYKITENCYYK